jgi:hypothetical protein
VIGDLRYGTLRNDPGLGWRFIPEIDGLRRLTYKSYSEDALPATVRRALLEEYYRRDPLTWGYPMSAT